MANVERINWQIGMSVIHAAAAVIGMPVVAMEERFFLSVRSGHQLQWAAFPHSLLMHFRYGDEHHEHTMGRRLLLRPVGGMYVAGG